MSKTDPPADFDVMKAWREWFVKNERDWSEAMTRMMKDDNVSSGLGRQFNASLVQQQALTKSMAEFMASMNMPTRDDFTMLGERIGQVEDAIARVEALLVQTKIGSASDAPKPPRTRKAPRKTKADDRHDAE
jgi:hypothetical protein